MRKRFATKWVAVPLIVLAWAIGCTTTSTPPLPPATQPTIEVLGPNDPTGVAPPQLAPFLYTKVVKFRIPSKTVFEVAVDGWLLRENTTANCGDDGCYEVLARSDDGIQTTYVIQAWPQAYKRFAHTATFQITDVSLNSNFSGAQLASRPAKLVVLQAAPPVLVPPTSPPTPEFAAANEGATLEFRTIPLSTAADADAYYQDVGAKNPADGRTTLEAWKQTNGFAADDSQDDAKVYYFNAGDLGLGRSMHMKVKPNGDLAYYVSNYPTVADAVRRTNLIATVAMEYTPGSMGGARFMKFFVFDDNNAITPSADLDGNGQKFVPNLCVICHGMTKYVTGGSANLGARLLPFDLRTFQYVPTQSRASQEASFKQLNLAILQSDKSAAQESLLQAWYDDPAQAPGNLARQTQNDDGIPVGDWQDPQHRQLYLDVVRPSCRACHVVRNAGLDFGTFTAFSDKKPYVVTCSERAMPNAKVTYERFWLQHLQGPSANQAAVIGAAGLTDWPGPCPTP